MKRLARIVGSFLIVVSAYWVYARTAVPWIEPSAERMERERVSQELIEKAKQEPDKQRLVLKHWFAAGDWELTSPKILGTPDGMLLLKTYEPLRDEPRKVRLVPCTMIMLPKGQFASEEERARRAIVLRAEEEAILEFDKKFDLSRGDLDQMTIVGGQLIGPVSIRSEQRSTGPEDDLRIVTHDVTMKNDRITTPHLVTFDYGPNHGLGRDLVIELPTPAEKAAQPRGSPAASIKSIHLARDVRMRMQPGAGELLPGGAAPAKSQGQPAAETAKQAKPPIDPPADAAKQAKPPIEITCQGPFHLDLLAQVATYQDQVDVVQLNFAVPSDQMTCDHLSIFFETVAAEVAAASSAPAAGNAAAPGANGTASSTKVQPSRFCAKGRPVVITSPSKGVRARGRQLDYDIQKGSGDLTDEGGEVVFRQKLPDQTREIHAPKLHFEGDPNDPEGSRPNVFLAAGKGWFKGQLPGQGPQPIDVRWTRSLHFRPYQKYQVLSVNGKAHVVTASGMLDADEIDVYLVETPAPAAAGAASRTELSPRKLRALGHVRIESEQITGVLGDLQMWFDPKAPPTPTAAADGAAPPPPPPEPEPEPEPKTAKNQHFHVSGNVLEANVNLDGPQPQVTKMRLNGRVYCKETRTEKPGEKPMIILGDRLTLAQTVPEQAVVAVTGQPAHVEARGMTLLGGSSRQSGTVHFHRGENRIWVKDPGTLTLPGERGLDGRPSEKNEPVEIAWQGGMEFDGRTAEFTRDVEARQEQSRLRTPSMVVLFTKQVRFDSTNTGEPQPEVDRIVCRRGVELDNRELQELTGEVVSVNHLVAQDLTIHQASGDLLAHGPGTVDSVRVDTGESDAFLPAGTAKSQAQENDDETRDEGFNFLSVRFHREMRGNLRGKVMDFHGRVRAVYGPVDDWNERLSHDDPEKLAVGGFVLRSERLQVVQQTLDGKGENAFELTATDNAVADGVAVEDESFFARAGRLSYDTRKGLLVLDGEAGEAMLLRQSRPGSEPDRLAAEKILYHPASQYLKIDGVRSGGMPNLPASDDDSKPKKSKKKTK
ncbi:MAG TPA: hypothetical protein VGX78_23125 [Pirellulales bacterium]|nr:hypothetical protein [Pirellulales bacterium]